MMIVSLQQPQLPSYQQSPEIEMHKNNEGSGLPAVRRKLTKRTTLQEMPLSQSKPQFGQELSNDPGVFATSQPDIAKKIQQKMRVRRAANSDKKISQMELLSRENTAPRTADEGEEVLSRELEEVVDFLWENSQEVTRLVQSVSRVLSAGQFKAKLMGEASIMRCQAHNGDLEDIVMTRVRRMAGLAKSERQCQEQEKQMERMIEERMNKLKGLLR